MTLREVILQNWGKFIYLGSGQSFFWMGTADANCFDEINAIDRAVSISVDKCAKELSKARSIFYYYEKQAAVADPKDRPSIQKKLSAEYRNIQELESLTKGKPMLDREVTEVYDRRFFAPFGKIVTVEGREKGKYWSLDEWEANPPRALRGIV